MLSNQGQFARQLEERIAGLLEVDHCALFCNATVAMMCLFQALGLEGEVLVPSFTFAATAQALLWQGVTPVFVDIDRSSFTLDPAQIEPHVTARTSAIFPVNLFGSCCDHERFSSLSRRLGLPLIYDSAQAFGTRYRGRPVGSLGNAEVFSFHATKIFHTGEGGCITTNDSDLYRRLCRIRNFGFEGYLNCIEMGINGKMNEFCALIGLKLLDDLTAHINKRKWVFKQYQDSLKQIPGIHFPAGSGDVESNCSYFTIVIDPDEFGLSNIELNYALSVDRIVTRCYFFPPVHRTTYYQKRFKHLDLQLPNTDWAALHAICLPVYSDMQASELAMLIDGIVRCQFHAGEIKKLLGGKVPWGVEAMSLEAYDDPYDRLIDSVKQG
jgi:dTDP-4-amino-4,6-dideoxygalactose transaminase